MSTEGVIDLFFLLPLKLSGSILDVYGGEQGISPVNMGLTSASCPGNLPMKREITGNVVFIVSFFFFNQLHKIWVTYITKLNEILKILPK